MHLCSVVLGVRCCARAFSSCREQGLLLVTVRGLLVVGASLVGAHGLQVHGLQYMQHVGSVVAACALGLSCSGPCGSFLDQGWNLWPLH